VVDIEGRQSVEGISPKTKKSYRRQVMEGLRWSATWSMDIQELSVSKWGEVVRGAGKKRGRLDNRAEAENG
jgi:hypothetical protein